MTKSNKIIVISLILFLFIATVFIVLFKETKTLNKEFSVSADGRKLAFYKAKNSKNISTGKLWIKDLETGTEELVISEGSISNLKLKDAPPEISKIKNEMFSSDGKTLYFIDSLAYVTSGAVYSFDLSNKKINFIGGSNYLDIIREGKFKDKLILYKHEYFSGGGAYDRYYIIDPKNGTKLRVIGSTLDDFDGIGWDDSLSNLQVPDKYSDLCGFMANNCQGFSFQNGELPANLKDNIHGLPGNANISLIMDEAVSGKLIIDNKIIDIIAVPYSWVWASSGYGIYVVKNDNNKLEIVARIDSGKTKPEVLTIYDNKIFFSKLRESSTDSIECIFKDNKLSEEYLYCK